MQPSNCGFLLLSPDCTATGRHAEALGWLGRRGVTVVKSAWGVLQSASVDVLYASNRASRPACPSDELVNRLFTMGPSLGMLVTGPPWCDIHSYLARLKGASDPSQGSPAEHLRPFLGATNRVLNFVHSSDGPAAAEIDSQMFFSLAASVDSKATGLAPALAADPLVTMSGFGVRCRLK